MCGISTHDLARRSTLSLVKGKTYNKLFQLTTSQGGRLAGKSCIVGMLAFQLTTSQGGRQATAWAHDKLGLISTHDLTKRSTLYAFFVSRYKFISTHDLTKRSTHNPLRFLFIPIFQLTTSRRGRQQPMLWTAIAFLYFNSRPHEEVDLKATPTRRKEGYFNSRPHEEVDRTQLHQWSIFRYFNSRPHEEVDGIISPSTLGIDLFQLTTSRRGRPQIRTTWIGT